MLKSKCFLGFFGVDRSLPYTIDSITENILIPLEQSGYSFTCAAHFNVPIASDKEEDRQIFSGSHSNLPLEVCWKEPQDEGLVENFLSNLPAYPSPHASKDEIRKIYRSWLFAQHSLNRLWQIINLFPDDAFDAYFILRPDNKYIDKMVVSDELNKINFNEIELITPSWQKWGGLNDRFAICSRRGAFVYTNRSQLQTAFIEQYKFFHPEGQLLFAANVHNLTLGFTSTRAIRIRADGREAHEVFT